MQNALDRLTRELAIDIARDGEGASKLAEITVTGAAGRVEAKTIALAIANSPLVKTALAGADPNWGRILGAAGKAGVPFDPQLADIYVNGAPGLQGRNASRLRRGPCPAKHGGGRYTDRTVLVRGQGKQRSRMDFATSPRVTFASTRITARERRCRQNPGSADTLKSRQRALKLNG